MNRIPLSIEVRKVLKLLVYTLLGLLMVVSAYFFVKMSSTAESGYLFKESQMKKQELEAEHRMLEQRVLDAQSLNRLKNSNTVKGMEQPEKPPEYVEPRGPLSRRK